MRSFLLCLLLAGPAFGLVLSPALLNCIKLVAIRAFGQPNQNGDVALRQCLPNIPVEIKSSVDQLLQTIGHIEPRIGFEVAYMTCMGDLGKSLQDGTPLPPNCVDLFIRALDGIRAESVQPPPPQQPLP